MKGVSNLGQGFLEEKDQNNSFSAIGKSDILSFLNNYAQGISLLQIWRQTGLFQTYFGQIWI
jgi:hypothetical protein